ncbi:MAG: GNAT family N-acetyltransferase [Candidatus Latescibacteria bacterium]|nr:GNAT family N-acetyltransferase [Candidatus Latescibacterota bacterium]
MYQSLDRVALKSGESVDVGVVQGPDADWSERVESLLGHKGPPWRWGNEQVLRTQTGLDAFFYLLHRDGEPFANMMTIEYGGVGLFGHVYTQPEDRRQGAAMQLMSRLMEHFGQRGGRALYLGTGYDSPPFHIYRANGFAGIEPESGYMAYYTDSQEEFDAAYFAPGATAIEPLSWLHWPTSPALFLGDFPGVVRSVGLDIWGRRSTEGPLLPLLMDDIERRQEGRPPRALALVQSQTRAVVGWAMWSDHPLWPDACLVDLYCHPDFWDGAAELVQKLELPDRHTCLAYGDTGLEAKATALSAAGFSRSATLKERVCDRATGAWIDADVWER